MLASAADSVVDIASQAVLALADWQVGKVDPQYPVGKTRLQTVAVIACAVIMSFATLAVIQESGKSLYGGIATGNLISSQLGPCTVRNRNSLSPPADFYLDILASCRHSS